jgi:ABC-type polysaccharide/polyol phosphate transport system ATPase subunit
MALESLHALLEVGQARSEASGNPLHRLSFYQSPLPLSAMSADTSAPAVVFDGVSKSFVMPHERAHTLKERVLHPLRRSTGNRLDALRDVSFAVEQGEFFGIVGRNGSGKSTLLKCLAGIYRVDQGEIYVNGRLATFIELGVGFNPDLAARDNVMINAVMLGVPAREARRRFDDIIAFAELEEFVDLKIKNYSSGMLVRLAFATAIQSDADILLIDEVLAVGDASFQQKCFDVFNRLKEEGRTILFVTHDMGSVTRFCDRAMLLERGSTVTIDTPQRAAEQYLEVNFARDLGASDRDGLHWETGTTKILEVWTENTAGERVSTFMATDSCVFKARITFLQEMEDPNFNVVWVNEHGHSLFAVSNVATGGTGRFAAGETVTLGISFLPSLAPGRYGLTMNIARRGGEEIVERWHDMYTMLVASPNAGGGLVDLPYEMRIDRSDAVAESTR